MPNPSIAAYKSTSIQSASPGQLVIALYDGAVAAVSIAYEAHLAGAIEARGLHIDKAQAIIAELISSLNFDVDSELCERLFNIYLYISRRLFDAVLHDTPDALLEARKLLSQLRSAWAQAGDGA